MSATISAMKTKTETASGPEAKKAAPSSAAPGCSIARMGLEIPFLRNEPSLP
jgi:hypothetical protein